MKILFDENMPKPIKRLLTKYEVLTVRQMGWLGLENGHLLAAAVEAGFDVLLTIDKNMRHQQNMANYEIAVIMFDAVSNRTPDVAPFIPIFEQKVSTCPKFKIRVIERP